MANSTRYYQLTPNILLEYHYIYAGEIDDSSDATSRIIDLEHKNKLFVIDSEYDDTKYLFTRDEETDNKSYLNYSNLVLSMNKNYSKFAEGQNEKSEQKYDEYDTTNFQKGIATFENDDYCDVYYDEITLHFTGGDFYGSYDALIFQAFVKNLDNSNISLMSMIFKRTDSVTIDSKPMLINDRLYTSSVTYRIPSINFIINSPYGKGMLKIMSPSYKQLHKNPQIEFNVFGVKSTYNDSYFSYYNTEQLNSIQVPYYDSYEKVYIDIAEATDGDYFKININVANNGNTVSSFSDYMRSIDEHPEEYVIMNEISLIENYVDTDNSFVSKITHTTYHLVNLSYTDEDEGMDDTITFRPVCRYANKDVTFTIEDTLKIINTEDNTTIVKKATKDFSNPSKYGKKMGKIFLGDTPIQINVYNKRADEDVDYVKISNSSNGSNNTIENHQYNITALVEATNIGVTIQQVSNTDIE